jgi:hypothetical protein
MQRSVLLWCAVMGWAPASAYRFMAIGDWGASYTPPKSSEHDTCTIDPSVNCSTHGVSGCGYNDQQQQDGRQMGINAAKHAVDHVMLLGDNFYGSGIHGDDTSCRFKRTFEDIYSSARSVRCFYMQRTHRCPPQPACLIWLWQHVTALLLAASTSHSTPSVSA